MTVSVQATTPTASPSPFAVFRRRNFTLIWTGQLISTIGSSLTSLAASILVFRLTGSAMSVGLMLMATAAPSVIVGLIAGVYVDRYDRRRIMIIADLVRAGLVFLIPFLVPVNMAWLYVVVMLSSAVGQFYDPAHESLLPEVASDEELAAANSLMAISSFGSTAIGFAASGLIASRYPIEWAFYLDSISFLFSALCVLLIRIQPIETDESSGVSMVVQNLKAGIKTLFDTPVLRSLFYVMAPVLVAFGLSNALLLPFALRALNATEFEYGLQEGLTSLGFVAGSLVMASLAGRLREGQWLALSFLGMGLAGVAYSLSTTVPMAIVFVIISGFLNAPSAIARRLIVQRNTPREMRGRVNSAFFVSRDVLFLIGMACAGLADIINVRWMYLISSIIVLAGGVWALFLPGLRQELYEWRRAIRLLRTTPSGAGLGLVRAATLADFDALAGLFPPLAGLTLNERQVFVENADIVETPAETTILRRGEMGDAAYFVLGGKLVAGVAVEGGSYRSLETLLAGDFFGEIAALTGSPRTADVVAAEASTLLQLPAKTLRGLMGKPVLSQLILSKMTERLARTNLSDLPRFAGYDQATLRELRTEPAPQSA